MDQQHIGRFIAAKRRQMNLTQEQLAEMIGVSNKTVSKWETGKSMPDYSVIGALCGALNISVEELISGKDKESAVEKPSCSEELALLSYKVEQLERRSDILMDRKKTVKTGISFGSVLAVVISYAHWHSIGWAVFHGLLSWVYVIYYLIKY